MRRSFSILLILVFAFTPVSLLISGREDANLPACCRRHGVHHCSMTVSASRSMMARGSTPGFSAPATCPYYPGAATVFSTPPPALTIAMALMPGLAPQAQIDAAAIAVLAAGPNRTHAGRGPPAVDPS
jgi:hypothetical protein